jgi:serine/threonine-protein phosphatase 2A activator
MRFGNKAFRTWLDKVLASSSEEVAKLSNEEGFANAVPEIKVYLEESFGSYERLDYGTGHELNFVVFLFCLFKLGVFV